MSEWWLVGVLIFLAFLASLLMVYPLRRSRALSLLLIPFIFIVAGLGYSYWGGFTQWQQYLHQLKARKIAEQMMRSINSPQDLINQLRAKLDDSANSAKGWYLLGRLYSSQQDLPQAVQAFAKAYRFQPENEQFAVNYALSLWEQNHRQFTPEIKQILAKVLANNPNQADALALLAKDT